MLLRVQIQFRLLRLRRRLLRQRELLRAAKLRLLRRLHAASPRAGALHSTHPCGSGEASRRSAGRCQARLLQLAEASDERHRSRATSQRGHRRERASAGASHAWLEHAAHDRQAAQRRLLRWQAEAPPLRHASPPP